MEENYIHELCRLCLYKSENLFDIFGANGRHGYLAAEVIQDLLHIEVALSDGFPRCVCSVCLDKLTDFKLFKDQCLESRTTFQAEFGPVIELAKRQDRGRKNSQLNQDPLVCSSSIKVELKSEVEIVEIPVESDDIVKKEAGASPVRSEASDLDVVTIDDDDNVLCLGSKDELSRVPSAAAGKQPYLLQAVSSGGKAPKRSSAPRNRSGSSLRKQLEEGDKLAGASRVSESFARGSTGDTSSTDAVSGLTLQALLTSAPCPSDKTKHASSAEGNSSAATPPMEHPLWLDSEEDETSAKRSAVAGRRDRKSRQRTPRKQKLVPRAEDAVGRKRLRSPTSPGISRPSAERSSAAGDVASPDTPCGMAGEQPQHPLFDGDANKSSEPPLKQQRRVAASAQKYTEGSILLSSGNTPQGFVEWGCLGSELRSKKRKRRKGPNLSLKSTAAKGSVVVPAHGQSEMQAKGTTKKKRKKTQSKPTSTVGVAATGAAPTAVREQGKKSFTCSNCGQLFSNLSALYEHRKAQHKSETSSTPPITFPCPTCNRNFSSLQSMKRHQFLHSGLRPFACNLCHMGYTRIDHLKRHMEQSHWVKGAAAMHLHHEPSAGVPR